MYDLGTFSIYDSYDSRKDDAWIAYRLNQIAREDLNAPLISRWSFETKDCSSLSYLARLAARAFAFFCCFYPPYGFLALAYSRSGHFVCDYVVDRSRYLYAKCKGTENTFHTVRRLNQIFRTIAIAQYRLNFKERTLKLLREDPFSTETQRMYARCCKIGPINETLNRSLLNRVIVKTLMQLSRDELNILVASFNRFNADLACNELKNLFYCYNLGSVYSASLDEVVTNALSI